MFATAATCPRCGAELLVERKLFESGIELRCPECAHYFAVAPPGNMPAATVCGASVPISVWRSRAADD